LEVRLQQAPLLDRDVSRIRGRRAAAGGNDEAHQYARSAAPRPITISLSHVHLPCARSKAPLQTPPLAAGPRRPIRSRTRAIVSSATAVALFAPAARIS